MAAYRRRLPSTEELLLVARTVHAEAAKIGIPAAILGGLAMHLYGSPRLTKDVDFVSGGPLEPTPPGMTPVRKIRFGGEVYSTPAGIDVDWIVRADHYKDLYVDALARAGEGPEGVPLVRIEHLAAIKLAASVKDPKHYEDLLFLLTHPEIDLPGTGNLVSRFVGGQFGVEQLEAATEEARWRKDRSE